jgi:hypothetical protein
LASISIGQGTPNSISVKVQSNPSGRSFSVDGTTYATAQTFNWVPGSTHTIAATTTQSGGTGTQYIWSSWSDGLESTHTVAPSSSTIYTANFITQSLATVHFSAPNFTSSEGAGTAVITVARDGNTSGAASVDFATVDTPTLAPCSEVNGVAYARCDYATTIHTLTFAAGETSKTIALSVMDDAYVEGAETTQLRLLNASGAALGTQDTATAIIVDNDTAQSIINPLDNPDAKFFVRQQYIDFLGREPEPTGYQGWQNVLNNCGITVAPPCDRIEVSAGFFRSPEFQDRGYFIYRFFSAVGKIPLYETFMPDFAKVSGFLSAQQLEANKVAFVSEFMTRPDFQTKYGALTNPTSYVDALLQTVGLPNHPSRQTWITGLTNDSLTRAQVLRAVVESTEVYNKYYNEAFVIMQYFGYLRRSADISYLNWIQTMNSNGGDYRIMINGFLNSQEYRNRFGN